MEGPSGFRGTEAKRGGLGYQKKREKRVTGLGIYFDAAAAGLWHPAIFYKPMDIDSTAPSYVQELDGGPEFKEAYCLEGAHTVEKTGETWTSSKTWGLAGSFRPLSIIDVARAYGGKKDPKRSRRWACRNYACTKLTKN